VTRSIRGPDDIRGLSPPEPRIAADDDLECPPKSVPSKKVGRKKRRFRLDHPRGPRHGKIEKFLPRGFGPGEKPTRGARFHGER